MANGMPMPMMGGGDGAPAGPPAPGVAPPANAGLRTRGFILAAITIKMLTEVVRLLGATSEEGQDALKALTALSKRFGQSSGDLSRQEAKFIGDRAAPVEAPPTPQQGAVWQTMVKNRLSGMGMGTETPAPASPAPAPAPLQKEG